MEIEKMSLGDERQDLLDHILYSNNSKMSISIRIEWVFKIIEKQDKRVVEQLKELIDDSHWGNWSLTKKFKRFDEILGPKLTEVAQEK